jgi:tRNA/rRNA methyltransferase
MGIRHLVVVAPENLDLSRVQTMATRAAAGVVAQMTIFPELDQALAPYGHIVGTTARRGIRRQGVQNPAQAAEALIALSQRNPVAVLFGPEDRGLTNAEIRLCHSLVTIPTADFASLNLAQAVMIMCYAIFVAGGETPRQPSPRLATRHELEGMYSQLREVLIRINYINPQNPDHWLNRLRQFFNRLPLRAREVSIIRGICRQIDWYGRQRYIDGRKQKGV